jgi:hypothetical protein
MGNKKYIGIFYKKCWVFLVAKEVLSAKTLNYVTLR